MKVNPIGIQSYLQLQNKNNSQAQKADDANFLKTDVEKVTIKPQEKTESKLAVKAKNATFADYLSPEEKNVLDILFNRFKDTERFGASFKQDTPAVNENKIGSTIDLKV